MLVMIFLFFSTTISLSKKKEARPHTSLTFIDLDFFVYFLFIFSVCGWSVHKVYLCLTNSLAKLAVRTQVLCSNNIAFIVNHVVKRPPRFFRI